MENDMRGDLVEYFERDIGRPPVGARERVLSGLRGAPPHHPHRPQRRLMTWAALSGAVLVAVLTVATLMEIRLAPVSRPAGRTETPVPVAGPRSGAAVAYDAGRGVLVMFGGSRDGGVTALGDTWTWDGRQWTEQHPKVTPGSATPSASSRLLMAYDAASETLVLYGGPGPTWTWDGQNWRSHAGAAPDGAVAMAYDPASRAVLLYVAPPGHTSQTWRWDGANWTQLHPRTPPDVVQGAMAFDGRRLLLFGGPFGLVQGQALTETWAWDGREWSLLSPAVRLPLSYSYTAAYDQRHGRLLAFIEPEGTPSAETWVWDGTSWSKEHPRHAPTARSGAAAWYDSRTGRVLLYGGMEVRGAALGDMWAWDGSDWSLLEEKKR
jgi:hypothetical protein